MKKSNTTLLLIMFLSFTLFSCKDDITGIAINDHTIEVVLPEELQLEGIKASDLKVTLKNVNTGRETTQITNQEGKASFSTLTGLYTIKISGEKSYPTVTAEGNDTIITRKIGGLLEDEILKDNNSFHSIQSHIVIDSKGWVIKEMYTASTHTLNGSSLRFDQFIEIYNNTDSVMYADGLTIGETRHQTTSGENIYKNDMDRNTYLWTVYSIPGKNGERNVAVQPGKSIVIAPQPIDHTPDNSINLRPPVSDYQWFDPHGSGEYSIDVPEVPNLITNYSYTLTVWVVSVQMNRGFVIFKLPEGASMSDFIRNNSDSRFNNAGTKVISIAVPNDYIYDAIELGPKSNFYRKSLSSSLDMGYSYTVETYNGKSIRRKIEKIESDGRIVYQDTNNSTEDFLVGCTPKPKQYPTTDEK